MKSLRRLISILLAAACFMLAVTGAYGIYRTRKTYRNDMDYLDVLNDKTERYREINDTVLSDTPEYRKAAAGLGVSREIFEEKAAGHRSELAIYTASKSGIKQGEKALNSARAPLANGKAQLASAEAQLNAGAELYYEYQEQIEDGKAQIEALRQQLNVSKASLQAEIDISNEKLALIAQQREESGAPVPEEPSEEYQTASAEYATLKSLCDTISAYSGYSPDNPDSVALADGMAVLSGYSDYASMLYQLSELEAEVERLKPPVQPDDPYAEEEAGIRAELEELNIEMQSVELQLSGIESSQEAIAAAEEMIAAVFAAGQEMLDDAKAKLAAGEAQLNAATQKIRETKKELADTENELSGEIAELAAERDELDRRQNVVDVYKENEAELEDRGYRLLNYEEIKTYHESGATILESADKFSAEYSETAEVRKTDGTVSGVVSILALAVAAIGIATAFKNVIPNFLRWLPAADCFILALAAQKLRFTGIDSIMYSALITAVFASAAIIVNIIPDNS